VGSAAAMVIVLVFKSRALVRRSLGRNEFCLEIRIIILLYLAIPTYSNHGNSRHMTRISVSTINIYRGDRYNETSGSFFTRFLEHITANLNHPVHSTCVYHINVLYYTILYR